MTNSSNTNNKPQGKNAVDWKSNKYDNIFADLKSETENDLQQNNSSKKSSGADLAKNWISIYDKQADKQEAVLLSPKNTSFSSEIIFTFSSGIHISPEQPPDFVAA